MCTCTCRRRERLEVYIKNIFKIVISRGGEGTAAGSE